MDPIEAAMGDDAVVLHREKLVSRGMAGVGFGLGAFTTVAAIAATQNGEVGMAGAGIMGVIAVAFVLFGIIASVKRIALTREDIRVVATGRSHVVPLAKVVSASLSTFRRNLEPAAVTVKWRDGGREHALFIESQDPKALLAAIEGARSRVRVAAPNVETREEKSVEEEEPEGDEADAKARAR